MRDHEYSNFKVRLLTKESNNGPRIPIVTHFNTEDGGYVPLKTNTRPRGVTTQKTAIDFFTAVTTSYLSIIRMSAPRD
jgi:hypothetical protein